MDLYERLEELRNKSGLSDEEELELLRLEKMENEEDHADDHLQDK